MRTKEKLKQAIFEAVAIFAVPAEEYLSYQNRTFVDAQGTCFISVLSLGAL